MTDQRALPADSHVHTEWSWDAVAGSMERTCERAVALGVPAVAFTDHADYTTLTIPVDSPLLVDHGALVTPDRTLPPPKLDLDGYLACVQRCRDRFPELRILTGVELGEAHRNSDAAARLLAAGQFDRVLGSLHSLPVDGRYFETPDVYRQRPADAVVREYLAEVARLIAGSDAFEVFAHIDYAARYWPADAGTHDPNAFQDDYRHALRVLAGSGRALEVNTQVPLNPVIVRWWREEGGEAVTFGSDAHDPSVLADGFRRAAAMVEAHGFRAGRHPHDFWTRSG